MLYDNVKALCGMKKIPISKLELDLNFPRSYICKWNENEPGIYKVEKVADYLGTTVDALLSEGKEKTKGEKA